MAEHTQQLTPEDKEFIKLHEDGVKNSPAFREAYPSHPATLAWNMTKPNTPERQKASEMVKDAAKSKLKTKYISRALATYHDKMEEFSRLSLETATELVKNARSEKVRADLAIEGIRHKVGTPVQKVAVQESKTVILTFGKPSHSNTPSESSNIIEGEVIDSHDSSEDECDEF